MRKKSRILPTELPLPFFHANDIDSVIGYISEFANDHQASQSDLPGSVGGTCYLCNQEVDFSIVRLKDGETVSWRETLTCPKCRLINRWRSCLHVFEEVCKPTTEDRIYLTESLSPVCQNLAARFPLLSSSE